MDAIEARGAGARVAVHAVSAVGTILAWIAGAFVDVLLTEGTLEAGQAVAEGRVDPVSAGTPVVTWVGSAVIDVTGSRGGWQSSTLISQCTPCVPLGQEHL